MKIIYGIFYSFFVVLLLAVAGLFLMPLLPIDNNIAIKIVESGSMEPSISTGALVVVRPHASYGVGDVITFKSAFADIPTTHRILEIREENGETFFMTKGDANEEADTNETNARSVIGKVAFDVPYAGFILDFARQPMGFAFLIVLPALMIVFGEIEKIWREARKRKEKVVESSNGDVDDGGNSGGAEATPVVRMMDIACPIYMPGVQVPSEVVAQRISFGKEIILPSIIVLASILFTCMSFIGGTVSYFNDMESSLSNVLKASLLDFTALAEGPEYAFVDGDDSVTISTTIAPENGSMLVEYEVHVDYVSGNPIFCSAVIADAGTPIVYTGPLLSLVAGGAVFDPTWDLELSLDPLIIDYLPLDTCVADVVFTAWYANGDEGDGYSDIEKVRLTLTAPGAQLLRIAPLSAPASFVEDEPLTNEPVVDEEPTEPPAEPIVEEEPEPEVIPEPEVEEQEVIEEPEPEPEAVEETPIV